MVVRCSTFPSFLPWSGTWLFQCEGGMGGLDPRSLPMVLTSLSPPSVSPQLPPPSSAAWARHPLRAVLSWLKNSFRPCQSNHSDSLQSPRVQGHMPNISASESKGKQVHRRSCLYAFFLGPIFFLWASYSGHLTFTTVKVSPMVSISLRLLWLIIGDSI